MYASFFSFNCEKKERKNSVTCLFNDSFGDQVFRISLEESIKKRHNLILPFSYHKCDYSDFTFMLIPAATFDCQSPGRINHPINTELMGGILIRAVNIPPSPSLCYFNSYSSFLSSILFLFCWLLFHRGRFSLFTHTETNMKKHSYTAAATGMTTRVHRSSAHHQSGALSDYYWEIRPWGIVNIMVIFCNQWKFMSQHHVIFTAIYFSAN